MIVLDCNAAIAVAQGTPEGEALAALMLDGERAIAPQLFVAELTHVVAKYVRGGFLSREEGLRMGRAAFDLVDEFIPVEPFWEEVCAESVRLQHSAYDLFYLTLARRTASTLFTLDKQLQSLCLDNGVECVHLATL